MDALVRNTTAVRLFLQNIVGNIAALILLGTLLFAMLEIVRRYILGLVFEWGQDAIIMSMMTAVALYISATQVNRNHLVMGAFIEFLAHKGAFGLVAACRIFCSFAIGLFCATMCYTAWPSVSYSLMRDIRTESLLLPLGPFHLILMIGFGLMAFVALLQLIEDVVMVAKGEHKNAELDLISDV